MCFETILRPQSIVRALQTWFPDLLPFPKLEKLYVWEIDTLEMEWIPTLFASSPALRTFWPSKILSSASADTSQFMKTLLSYAIPQLHELYIPSPIDCEDIFDAKRTSKDSRFKQLIHLQKLHIKSPRDLTASVLIYLAKMPVLRSLSLSDIHSCVAKEHGTFLAEVRSGFSSLTTLQARSFMDHIISLISTIPMSRIQKLDLSLVVTEAHRTTFASQIAAIYDQLPLSLRIFSLKLFFRVNIHRELQSTEKEPMYSRLVFPLSRLRFLEELVVLKDDLFAHGPAAMLHLDGNALLSLQHAWPNLRLLECSDTYPGSFVTPAYHPPQTADDASPHSIAALAQAHPHLTYL